MFSGFPMGPAASGRELSDIDQILFRVTKSRVHKSLQKKDFDYHYIFAVPGHPIYLHVIY